MVALWAVMTRLEEPAIENYALKELSTEQIEIASVLTPIEKAKLYNGELPEELEDYEKMILKDKYLQKVLRNEHPLEGINGVSPRVIQNMLTDIISENEKEGKQCLSIFKLFNHLENLLEKGDPKIFAPFNRNALYKNPKYALYAIDHEYHNRIAKEVKWAIIGLKKEDVEAKIKDYIRHVKAYVRNEKIEDKITGNEMDPDEKVMEWIEEKLEINYDKDEFRRELIRKMAYARIENKDMEEIDSKSVYSDLFENLENGLFNEKLQKMPLSLEELKYGIKKFGTEKFEELSKSYKKYVKGIIDYMVEYYGYCENCAKEVLLYSLENNFFEKYSSKYSDYNSFYD